MDLGGVLRGQRGRLSAGLKANLPNCFTLSDGSGELPTLKGDIDGWLKEYFKDLLNLTCLIQFHSH